MKDNVIDNNGIYDEYGQNRDELPKEVVKSINVLFTYFINEITKSLKNSNMPINDNNPFEAINHSAREMMK